MLNKNYIIEHDLFACTKGEVRFSCFFYSFIKSTHNYKTAKKSVFNVNQFIKYFFLNSCWWFSIFDDLDKNKCFGDFFILLGWISEPLIFQNYNEVDLICNKITVVNKILMKNVSQKEQKLIYQLLTDTWSTIYFKCKNNNFQCMQTTDRPVKMTWPW